MADQNTQGQINSNTVTSATQPTGIIGSAQSTTAAGYDPSKLGDATKWNVTPDQTAQGQMAKMADPNSAYYQAWSTAGAQDAAARGFTGNSSIRQTGILNAVMQNATPIAINDAGVSAKAANYNTDTSNQFAVNNQNAVNTANQFSAGQVNQRAIANQSTQSQQLISQAHDANSLLIQNNGAASTAYNNYVNAVASIDSQSSSTMSAEAKSAAISSISAAYQSQIDAIKSASPNTPIGQALSPTTEVMPTSASAQTPAAIPDVSALLRPGMWNDWNNNAAA